MEATKFLEDFLKDLRSLSFFKAATIVFCAERNTAHESHFLAESVKKFGPCYLYTENIHNPDDYGKRTTGTSKVNEVRILQKFLNLDAGFMKGWIATNNFSTITREPEQLRQLMKEKIIDQMSRYNIRLTGYYGTADLPRYVVTGKADPDGNRSSRYKDDIMIALGIAASIVEQINNRELDIRQAFIGAK